MADGGAQTALALVVALPYPYTGIIGGAPQPPFGTVLLQQVVHLCERTGEGYLRQCCAGIEKAPQHVTVAAVHAPDVARVGHRHYQLLEERRRIFRGVAVGIGSEAGAVFHVVAAVFFLFVILSHSYL